MCAEPSSFFVLDSSALSYPEYRQLTARSDKYHPCHSTTIMAMRPGGVILISVTLKRGSASWNNSCQPSASRSVAFKRPSMVMSMLLFMRSVEAPEHVANGSHTELLSPTAVGECSAQVA